MVALYFKHPYSGTRSDSKTRVSWEVSEVLFEPRREGDPEPDEKLVRVITKECVKQDGTRPSEDELKTLKLQQGLRDAFAIAFYDPLDPSWPNIQEMDA